MLLALSTLLYLVTCHVSFCFCWNWHNGCLHLLAWREFFLCNLTETYAWFLLPFSKFGTIHILFCRLSSTILQEQQRELLWNHHELIMEVRFLCSLPIHQVWISTCLLSLLTRIVALLENVYFAAVCIIVLYTYLHPLWGADEVSGESRAACHCYSWSRVMVWQIVSETHKVVTTLILIC